MLIPLVHADIRWLIRLGWPDKTCQLGWSQWYEYALSGEWM